MTRSGETGTSTGSGAGSGSLTAGSLSDSGKASRAASKGSAGRDKREAGSSHLCTFIVGGQRFALSTALVRELVEVTNVTRVPRTDGAFIGLFNLRGEPMPLVDLAMVLGIGASPPTEKMPVIIVRSEGMSVGARIDALGTVLPNTGLIASSDPTPLLLGFLPGKGDKNDAVKNGPVAVINAIELLARLGRLKQTTSER